MTSSENDKPKVDKCLKKSNILVYKTPMGEKKERPTPQESCSRSPNVKICTPEAKKIRVCTGAELKKMCPPPECHPKAAVSRRGLGILRLLGFGLKAAVAAACIYVTYDLGVWGSTEETQDLYRNACAIFTRPQAKKRDNSKWEPPSCQAESELWKRSPINIYGDCDQPAINMETAKQKFQKYWNFAVMKVFTGIAGFPANIRGQNFNWDHEKKSEGGLGKCECIPYKKLEPEDQEKVKNRYK